jgi:hypothetical protein
MDLLKIDYWLNTGLSKKQDFLIIKRNAKVEDVAREIKGGVIINIKKI